MSRPKITTRYDRYIIESYQMGLLPYQVYEKINYQELIKNEPPVISRKTLYNRYNEWCNDGRYGEVELIRTETLEDGSVVSYWKPKEK